MRGGPRFFGSTKVLSEGLLERSIADNRKHLPKIAGSNPGVGSCARDSQPLSECTLISR